MSGLLHCFLPDGLQLPLFPWTAKTSVWRQLRTVACMRNAAPCGQNMLWPAPSVQQPLTTAATARNATKPCGASWSACQRSTASLCSSVPALTLCVGSAGGKPSSRRVPMRRTGGGRKEWASPTASACRTTAPEMSCVGKTGVWVRHSSWSNTEQKKYKFHNAYYKVNHKKWLGCLYVIQNYSILKAWCFEHLLDYWAVLFLINVTLFCLYLMYGCI